MDIRIEPGPLGGAVAAIPSKSEAHRLLICAALADRETTIRLSSSSEDIEATLRCLEALGAGLCRTDGAVRVQPIRAVPPAPRLDCGESGSTLRFLLPVAAALADEARFTGGGRLPERPIGQLAAAMADHGVTFSAEGLPFTTRGRLAAGDFALPGNVSSQFFSGLLLALAALGGDGTVRYLGELESAAYVELTRRALSAFGVETATLAAGWAVPGGQRLRSPGLLAAEGDWSNAAFFLAAGALSDRGVTATGLDPDSPQGDKAIQTLLALAGGSVAWTPAGLRVRAGALRGFRADLRDTPDALPVLAVLAACASGESQLTGAARLRLKESDRLAATARLIRDLGGGAEVLPDGLRVFGGGLRGGTVDGCGDHRIVMAAAVAACACREPVVIRGAEAVNKSYPGFFTDYTKLGGKIHVL